MKKITLLVISVLVVTIAMAQEVFPNVAADPDAVPIVESILGLLVLFVVPLVLVIVVLKILLKNKRDN